MSSVACIICGYWILAEENNPPWLRQFRILYSRIRFACISGVGLGLGRPSEWRAPVDENIRCDKPDYYEQGSGWVMFGHPDSMMGHRNFAVHDACWCLLKVALAPEDVPMRRLIDVCMSLPNPTIEHGMYRDYNYGGIMLIHAQNEYPLPDFTHLNEKWMVEKDPYNVEDDDGMRNRKRIWKEISSIRGLLELRRELRVNPVSGDNGDPVWIWTQVSANTKKPEPTGSLPPELHNGCWVLAKAHVVVPESLTHIAFSIIRVGKAEYVAGLRLISTEEPYRPMGYRADGNERSFAVSATFRGFIVAVGRRGIHALQVVCEDGTVSPWFGSPKAALITTRLFRGRPVVALEAEMDGYKLVSLSIAEDGGVPSIPDTFPDMCLRASACWFPCIPYWGLIINDPSFIGDPTVLSCYRAMPWVLFVSAQGHLVPYLTEVSVSRTMELKLHAIRFIYGGQSVEIRLTPRPAQIHDTQSFFIDGDGGEFIDKFTTFFTSPGGEMFRGGRFSFEITTNRNRSFHFYPDAQPDPDATPHPLNIQTGTKFVGLFICQDPEDGIVGLGAISSA